MVTLACALDPYSVILARMSKGRLEAFSDGVIAIIITIMVLELHAPKGADWVALSELTPIFFSYVLSFIFIGIYWNNHHHLLQVAKQVNGRILWANLHLLFWLSLVPFVTGWMGENDFAPLPTAVYGGVLLACAIAFTLLQTAIIRAERRGHLPSNVGRAAKRAVTGKASMALSVAAIPLAFVREGIAQALYVVVALIWLVPDRRFERAAAHSGEVEHQHVGR